jgi:hypothetical protein
VDYKEPTQDTERKESDRLQFLRVVESAMEYLRDYFD